MDLWYGKWLANAGLRVVIQFGTCCMPSCAANEKKIWHCYGHDIDVFSFSDWIPCYMVRSWQHIGREDAYWEGFRRVLTPHGHTCSLGNFGEFIVSLAESEDLWLVQKLKSYQTFEHFRRGSLICIPQPYEFPCWCQWGLEPTKDLSFQYLKTSDQWTSSTRLITLNEVLSLSVFATEGAGQKTLVFVLSETHVHDLFPCFNFLCFFVVWRSK